MKNSTGAVRARVARQRALQQCSNIHAFPSLWPGRSSCQLLSMCMPPCPLQRFLPGGRLASKSSDGRMFVWRLRSSSGASTGSDGTGGSSLQLEMAATWKVPACSSAGGWANRCQFGSTLDGCYIAAVRTLSTARAAGQLAC